MLDYERYRLMEWTSDEDLCEYCDDVYLDKNNYEEGRRGHYCSTRCMDEAEGGGYSDHDARMHERRQMGLTGF